MDNRIEKALIELKLRLHHPPDVEMLARSLGLSVSRFQHLFKTETGASITKYIKDLRLQKARELLETTHLSVKEIRAQVGATDEAHFLTDFKKEFGVTPTEYRKNFRN